MTANNYWGITTTEQSTNGELKFELPDLIPEETWFSWITETSIETTTGETTFPNYEATDISWDTESIVKVFDDIWATDRYIAESYFEISQLATKAINTWWEYWIEYVPDYPTRKAALDSMIKLKWLLDKKKQKDTWLPKNVIYVLKK